MVESTMTATPKFTLGAYLYDPSSTDPKSEAWFENQFNAFSQAMGAKPQFMDAFTDYYVDWSQWVPIQDELARSWAASPVLLGVTPVMTIPMATTSDWNNADQVYKDIIAGKHDDVFVGLINSWKKVGYVTVDARIGPEMNGTFEPWYMGSDPATVADWTAAFQHIANLVHSVPGITVRTVWNPADLNYTAQPTVSAYPGDKYVDVLGVDVYSVMWPPQLYDWHKNDGTVDASLQQWFADPVNREHYWMNPNATEWNPNGYDPSQWGFKQVLAFAKAHNLPLGIAETGAGGNGTSTGPIDDPDFPKWLYEQLSQPGAPKVDYVNIWDITPSDGNWEFTNGTKPLEAAAWRQYFGVPQASGDHVFPTPPTVGSGPDTLVLAMSEDAFQGDAQFTVSLDGTQLGGVLTTAAWHNLGQGQNFTFNGSWGAVGPHIVTVTFLNDAWGGAASLDRNLYVNAVTFDGVAQQTNVEQGSAGPQTFGVGTAATSISFVDSAKTRFLTAVAPTATGEFGSWDTKLNNNVYQWLQPGRVTGIGAGAFDTVQVATLIDGSGSSFRLNDFVEANATLNNAPNTVGSTSTLTVDNAMRGSIALGAGNYAATINVRSVYADVPNNTFRISMGSGNDSLTLNGDASRTYANVAAGSGTDSMTFVNVLNTTVTGGSGAATVLLGSGAATVTAGTGSMDVTGGTSADTYVAHAGLGLMTIENFSLAKGDALQVDKALQASLLETPRAGSVMLSFGTDPTKGVMLNGLTTLAPTSITWV